MQEKGKLLELRQMLAKGLKPPVLVFVSTKERAKALCTELMYEKARVDAIHADQTHAARGAAVTNFRNGKTWVLITTDLLARGMDFLGVQAVVNYDFPGTKTDYIHRCGPGTARGGARGMGADIRRGLARSSACCWVSRPACQKTPFRTAPESVPACGRPTLVAQFMVHHGEEWLWWCAGSAGRAARAVGARR